MKPPVLEIEETVLRHPERIQTAIICAAVLAVMVKLLLSLLREHDISDILYIIFFWGIGFLAILSALIWSAAATTVVRKESKDLTISLALGRLGRWKTRAVFLKDLTGVVARERVYGFKGRKLRRYEILFGAGKEKSELLGREVLRAEPPMTTARAREGMKPPAHS